MLAPGSGLGCAFVDRTGLPLDGDTLAGMEAAHMPAPLHLLDAQAVPVRLRTHVGVRRGVHRRCPGCPILLAERWNGIRNTSSRARRSAPKERALALRGLAQKGDALALELFDFQARALGLHVATLAMALDPQFVVIGGGLMDPESTTAHIPRTLPEDRARRRRAVPLARPAQAC